MEGFDYSFNKIFVLKSLGEADTRADDLYYNTIEPCCKKEGLAIEPPIEMYDRGDWDKAIELILQDENSRPFIHIEMHGDKEKGLKLSLGDYVPWSEVIRDLSKINIWSECNAETFNAIYRRCVEAFFMYEMYTANRQRFRQPDSIA